MKVRVKVSIASAMWSYAPGDVAEVEDVEARRWIAAGIAEPVEPAGVNWGASPAGGPGETAAVEPPEQAVMPKPRKRGK